MDKRKNLDEYAEQVKDLGRRARARLEQERSKRPEIVRWDAASCPPPLLQEDVQKKLITPRTEAKKQKSRTSAGPRTAPRKRQKRNSNTVVEDSSVDRWMPNLSHLPTPTKETCSRLVRLHGLPFGALPAQIRRFFAGLNVQQICLLPSCCKDDIFDNLDATDQVPRKMGGIHVKRYAETVRVFVLFESATMAFLARERSGEIIPLEDTTAAGVAIGVSNVSKSFAIHFLKHVVIESIPGIPLHETLQSVEQNLDPSINGILWKSTEVELNLLPRARKPHEKNDFCKTSRTLACTSDDCHRLELHRNRILQTYENLKYKLPYPSAAFLDPALVDDSVVRLTVSAAYFLQREIGRLNDKLLRLRHVRFLEKSRQA